MHIAMVLRIDRISRLKRLAVVLLLAFPLEVRAWQEPLVFAHISDTHVGTEKAAAHLRQFFVDLDTLRPRPLFILHSGDLTNLGSQTELQAYLRLVHASPIPIYAVPGNHEVRWANVGKKRFERLIGPKYIHFSKKGIHFIGLDTSMLIEQYGHIEQAELQRLRADLASLPRGTTVIPFAHHPPLHGDYVDNTSALMELLHGHDVPLFLTGHGHSTLHWKANGIDFVMTEGLVDDDWGYRLIEVTDDSVRVYLRSLADTTLTLDFTRARRSLPEPEIRIVQPQADALLTGKLQIELVAPEARSAAARLSRSFELIPMEAAPASRYHVEAPLDSLPAGRYRLEVRVVDRSGMPWSRWRPIRVTAREGEGTIQEVFSIPVGAGIQSDPVRFGDRLLFGSNDGRIYCADTIDGVVVWRFETGGPVLASPTISDGVTYCGSVSGEVFALDAASGALRWRRRIAESVYSSASVSSGRLYVGASDSSLYSLRTADGSIVWRFQTNGHVKARPLIHNGAVYLGSWDRFFYAVDAESGGLLWRQEISYNPYFPAATSNPVLAGGLIVVASHDHVVHAFDPASGDEVWRHEKSENELPGYSTGLVVGKRVFFGSISGHLFALDVSTGESLLQTQLGRPADPIFDSSPVWNGREVVVGSVGGRVYAVKPDSGELAWSYSLGNGYIFSTPLTLGERLYVGGMDGLVRALKVQRRE